MKLSLTALIAALISFLIISPVTWRVDFNKTTIATLEKKIHMQYVPEKVQSYSFNNKEFSIEVIGTKLADKTVFHIHLFSSKNVKEYEALICEKVGENVTPASLYIKDNKLYLDNQSNIFFLNKEYVFERTQLIINNFITVQSQPDN